MRTATIDPSATPASAPAGRRPISARKLAANRRNALKSTGPRTAEGKARSAQNACRSTGPVTARGKARCAGNARRHGLWAAKPIPPVERPAFVRLLQDTLVEYRLTTPVQKLWGLLFAHNQWMLKRLHQRRYEIYKSSPDADPLSALSLFESAEHRLNGRLMKLLRWLSAELDLRRLLSLPYAKAALASVGMGGVLNPSERREPTAKTRSIPTEATEQGRWPQNTGENGEKQSENRTQNHPATTSEPIEANAG